MLAQGVGPRRSRGATVCDGRASAACTALEAGCRGGVGDTGDTGGAGVTASTGGAGGAGGVGFGGSGDTGRGVGLGISFVIWSDGGAFSHATRSTSNAIRIIEPTHRERK